MYKLELLVTIKILPPPNIAAFILQYKKDMYCTRVFFSFVSWWFSCLAINILNSYMCIYIYIYMCVFAYISLRICTITCSITLLFPVGFHIFPALAAAHVTIARQKTRVWAIPSFQAHPISLINEFCMPTTAKTLQNIMLYKFVQHQIHAYTSSNVGVSQKWRIAKTTGFNTQMV